LFWSLRAVPNQIAMWANQNKLGPALVPSAVEQIVEGFRGNMFKGFELNFVHRGARLSMISIKSWRIVTRFYR
jgi:hypothetical protein